MGVSWVDPGGGASAGDGARAVVRETGFDHLRELEAAHLARRRDGDGPLPDEDDATGDLERGAPLAQRGTKVLSGGGGTDGGQAFSGDVPAALTNGERTPNRHPPPTHAVTR